MNNKRAYPKVEGKKFKPRFKRWGKKHDKPLILSRLNNYKA
jgi:hypothetical protein